MEHKPENQRAHANDTQPAELDDTARLPPVQLNSSIAARAAATRAGRNRAAHDQAMQGVTSAGQPLPHLERIQQSFGHHDVRGVRAHINSDAAAAAGRLGAEAYAVGNQVAFANQPDVFTAAHEAAHVVQQQAGVQLKNGFGEAGDVYEQHADAVADRVVRGESAADLLDTMAGNNTKTAGPTVQKKDTTTPPPKVEDTATTTLEGLVDSKDHDAEELCYMENSNKVKLILEAHKVALSADPKKATDNADEIGKVAEMIAFLDYALTFVESVNLKGKAKKDADKKLSDLAAAAFPDLDAPGATKGAKALYFLMSTQPGRIGSSPTPLRGGGVGAALTMMGGAEMIYEDEMMAGGLKPGAPLQIWWGGDYRLSHQEAGKTTKLSAKGVYQAIVKGKMHKDSDGIFGHSVTFVKYDEKDPHTIWYMQQWNNKLDSSKLGTGREYFVGANLSTTGEAVKSAEYVLRDTEFKADPSKDAMEARAKKYKLDATKLTAALITSINSSGHANLADIQAAVGHHGKPSEFDHDMVRLIGLWQYAMGDLFVDGDFGDKSSLELLGKRLKDASEIQVASP